MRDGDIAHATSISTGLNLSAEWARTQIEKYGRNNPWVLVNVFDRFPPHSASTLIGPDECAEATRRA